MSGHNALIKLRKLNMRDGIIVSYMALLILALPLLHRWTTLPKLMELFNAGLIPKHLKPMEPERVLYLTQALLKRHISVFRPNCVKQSLVLFHFLQAWGHSVQVVFGVEKADGNLAGHCWIELDGEPLAEPANPRQAFTVTYEFPTHANARRRTVMYPSDDPGTSPSLCSHKE